MKKNLLFLAFFFCLQGMHAQGIKFGVKAGANISDVTGQSLQGGFKFGYHAGAFAALMFSDKFGIQPEVLLSETTMDRFTTASTAANAPVNNIKLQYLTVPVLLNLKPISFITLQAGPQFGILANKSESVTSNVTTAVKKGDLSMLGGIQLNLLWFKVYGRYVVGLSNINDISSTQNWKSKTMQVGVGIGF